MTSVMIIDDEPEVQTLLSLMLNGEGFITRRVGSGAEAIEAYGEEPSDVVITDLRMPEMDGTQVIEELKRIDPLAAIIVLTGYGDIENAVDLMQGAGVYNYLTKPLDTPEVLIAAIRSALEKRRLSIENQNLMAELEQANAQLEVQVADRTGALVASNRQLSLELQRRRRSEQALEKERADLERRVKERTHKLAHMNRDLNMEVIERRRSEAALRRSRLKAQIESQELELFYRNAPVGLCLLDPECKFIKVNPTMAAITGHLPESHKGESLEAVSPILAKALLPIIRKITATGDPIPSHVVSLPSRTSTTQLRHWLVSSYPLLLDAGEKIATSHIFQDITRQRKIQDVVRTAKTMLQAVFDGIQDPLIMVERSMEVRMINRAAMDYYGIDAYEKIIGKECGVIFSAAACATCRIPDLVSTGRPASFERRSHLREGKLEHVAVYPLCKSVSGLDGAIIQISDITENRDLQRQLFHSEKLASLGMLASGVAHEINNPNSFITFNLPLLRNYISAVMSHVASNGKLRKDKQWFGMSFNAFYTDLFQLIDNMEHGAQRIANIVSSMNALAQSKAMSKGHTKCSMRQIIKQVETLSRGELERLNLRLTITCPPDLPELWIDSGALEQVLINLLMNAVHAADKTDGWIRLKVERPHRNLLVIVVQDNGCGMDEAVRRKICDPFFTTKAPGNGSGLGLAVSHNLVASMGGTIQIESVLGQGSTFRIQVPDAFASESNAPETLDAPPTALPEQICGTG